MPVVILQRIIRARSQLVITVDNFTAGAMSASMNEQ